MSSKQRNVRPVQLDVDLDGRPENERSAITKLFFEQRRDDKNDRALRLTRAANLSVNFDCDMTRDDQASYCEGLVSRTLEPNAQLENEEMALRCREALSSLSKNHRVLIAVDLFSNEEITSEETRMHTSISTDDLFDGIEFRRESPQSYRARLSEARKAAIQALKALGITTLFIVLLAAQALGFSVSPSPASTPTDDLRVCSKVTAADRRFALSESKVTFVPEGHPGSERGDIMFLSKVT